MGYGVEGGYRLIVRTDGKQIDSANLESIWENGGSGIDIRNRDVDEFIKGHPSLEGITSDEVRAVAEVIGNADVNRDGLKESIYLDQSQRDNGSVTLRIDDSSGNNIWSEQSSTSHAGWTSLFLWEQGGDYYLLRYLPGMWQGYCTYTYTLFTLEGGAENVVRSNTIEFDVNGVNKLDAPNMIAFAEEVNELLSKSILLLSSEGGEYSFGPSSAERFFERYSWLDNTPELYADGDDLKTRLVKYSEYAVSNNR